MFQSGQPGVGAGPAGVGGGTAEATSGMTQPLVSCGSSPGRGQGDAQGHIGHSPSVWMEEGWGEAGVSQLMLRPANLKIGRTESTGSRAISVAACLLGSAGSGA